MQPKPELSPQVLRGAIIGFGFIATHGHLPAYFSRKNQDVEIVAVADICPERLDRAREMLPHARLYSNYKALLHEEKSRLDFVDICTPPCDHEAIAIEAMKAGLHVLCEKPLTVSPASALQMMKVAENTHRVLFPVHNYRHAPVVKTIREILDSGVIGDLKSATLTTFRNTHARGVPEWKTDWRRHRAYSGGGIAMDHGSHTFYLTYDWFKSYPTSVTSKMLNQSTQIYDTEDSFNCVLTFPKGVAITYLTWTAGVRKVLYTLQGTSGAITVDDDNLELAIQKPDDRKNISHGAKWEVERRAIQSHWMDSSHMGWFNSLFEEFKDSIEQNIFVSKQTWDSFHCIQTISKAYESSEASSRELFFSPVAQVNEMQQRRNSKKSSEQTRHFS